MSLFSALIARIKRARSMPLLSLNFSRKFSWTGYTNIKDRNELIDAILVAYDNPAYKPVIKDGKVVTTYCNIAAHEIAHKMGCTDLFDVDKQRVRMADEIYDFMVAHPEKWQEIQCVGLQPDFRDVAFQAIQFQANSGSLIFAVQSSKNLGAGHGHICIIRPGVMKNSGKWGKIPVCMNIGGDNFIALGQKGLMMGLPVGINQAFVQLPRFFAWKGP